MKILITGQSSDISKSLGLHLTHQQHDVYFTTHSTNESSSSTQNTIAFNLGDPKASEEQLDVFLKQNSLDVLILNAASSTYRLNTVDNIDFTEADEFLKANIQGNLWLLQKVIPVFKKQNFGRIIFMSSLNVQHPINGYSVYAAAKSSLETIIKYSAAELGPYNITANSIRLGIIHTSRNDKFIRRSSIKQKMLDAVSLPRLGTPQDTHKIIDAVIDKESFINGATIEVSGGIAFI